jgi:hypothetical protein
MRVCWAVMGSGNFSTTIESIVSDNGNHACIIAIYVIQINIFINNKKKVMCTLQYLFVISTC